MLSIETGKAKLDEPRHYSSIIGAIGKILSAEWFPNNQRTRLMRCGSSSRSAGESIALRVLIEAGAAVETMGPAEITNWIWLIHCMALMSAPNRDPHSITNEARPGVALHRIGYGESRLGRLLDARGDTFHTLFEHAVRRLARAGDPINWSKVAPLILPGDSESWWAENARIAINRDFLFASVRSLRGGSEIFTVVDPLLASRVS
jgi:hypothetical protein